MRCRECGLELDARDRLRNGAYRCPECGTINHTAQSSRVSPSPYRRKRRSHFAPPENLFTRRFFYLPVWGWLAVLAVAIVAVVLLLTLRGRGTDATSPDMPVPEDVAILEMTANPVNPDESGAVGIEGAVGTDGAVVSEPTAAPATSAHNTGIAPNDFIVSFDWAMSYLNFTSTLTTGAAETGPSGEPVQNFSFEDWLTLRMILDPATGVIRSTVATAQIQADDEATKTRALQGLVSTLYGFDITMNAGAGLNELESMLAGMSTSYEKDSFSAVIVDNGSNYTLTINGKL